MEYWADLWGTNQRETVQPQTGKTKQGCVEEQKQKERNKDNTALHHFSKRRQELSLKKSFVQEKEKDLSLLEVNDNNQSRNSKSLFANVQIQPKDHNTDNKENVHHDLKVSIYPESSGNKEVKIGDGVTSELHNQEEYGTAVIQNNMQHLMGTVTVMKLLREEDREIKSQAVLNKIFGGVLYADAFAKEKKNKQKNAQVQNIPVKNKSTQHIQHTDYLKGIPKVKTIPSDFEGSGYTELQQRGDNDIFSFSGEGQPSEDLPGERDASGPDLEGPDIQIGFSGPSEAETTESDMRGPGYNEIPEKVGNSGNTIGAEDSTAKEVNVADVSLVEGSNDIIGTTKFKELPGKEGNRKDSGSQNAHQGKVEFHYPHVPLKEKRKGSGSDTANFNEIPKNGKSSTQKGTEHSNRNEATLQEKQRFSSKGKSQSRVISSPGLHNEVKNEIGSHSGPIPEENAAAAHNSGRKGYYISQRQNNASRRKDMSQRKDSWEYSGHHSNRSPSPRRTDDSSESSESSSSSESDGE
ncbi:PREDICTED: matrix extracellular phosphoglycoprotein [Elephantulus edwardii]|uniref:matrix extracellular phosphoglycoprotein n=1 Tax=Elephantulus edwardii TaxID=28737 RepID=UPI0003F0937C|nr:PREDICTED: matrix extracellular phosphoglycoprotein [Elephantulus edwardii]